jgi:O-methyltransferase
MSDRHSTSSEQEICAIQAGTVAAMPPRLPHAVRRRIPPRVVERWHDRNLRSHGHPLRVVIPHSLVDPMNLAFLQRAAQRMNVTGVRGAFVECGVYRGGSAGVLAHEAMRAPDRDLWLFDAFAGMPAAGEHDDARSHEIAGEYVGSEAQTLRILERVGMDPARTHLRVGWFEDTFPDADTGPVALLHVDCDFYDAVKLTLETFYARLSPGAYVVINDYGSYAGARRATDEFLAGLAEDIAPAPLDLHVVFFAKPEAGGRWPADPPIPDLTSAA